MFSRILLRLLPILWTLFCFALWIFFCQRRTASQIVVAPPLSPFFRSLGVPVIQVYLNKCPEHLRISLWQSRQFNERVILVSDSEECKEFTQRLGVEFANASLFFDLADDFNQTIFPKIPSFGIRRRFEVMCYQRWFILRSFMEKSNIQKAFYHDSDGMLYANVTELNENMWIHHEVGFLNRGGMFSFFSLEGIINVCDFFWELFRQGTLSHHYHDDNWGSKINDMIGFRMYSDPSVLPTVSKFSPYELAFRKNDPRDFFDTNTRSSLGSFNIIDSHKQVTWINGLPYFQMRDSGERRRVLGLHFSGGSKGLMTWYRRSAHPWIDTPCTCDRRSCINCWDLPPHTLEQPLLIYPGKGEMCQVEEILGWFHCQGSLTNQSVVYSFSEGTDLSWEEELIHAFGVNVFFFSPSPLPPSALPNLQTFRLNLTTTNSLQLRLSSIVEMLNHQWITLLKLDGTIDTLFDPLSYLPIEQVNVRFRESKPSPNVGALLQKQMIRKHFESNNTIFFLRKENANK